MHNRDLTHLTHLTVLRLMLLLPIEGNDKI